MEVSKTTRFEELLQDQEGWYSPPMAPRMLGGKLGLEFLQMYNDYVEADFPGNGYLEGALRHEGGERGLIRGAGLFQTIVASQIIDSLRLPGIRVASHADAERVIKYGFDLKSYSIITGLILRSDQDRVEPKNTPLAKDLCRQLGSKGGVLPVTSLELEPTDSNEYGLRICLKKGATKAPYSLLFSNDQKVNFLFFDTDENGYPRWAGYVGDISSRGGVRTVYVPPERSQITGITSICLSGLSISLTEHRIGKGIGDEGNGILLVWDKSESG
jgi:hypothetical protein